MEDPWAAGPSWSTSAKSSTSTRRPSVLNDAGLHLSPATSPPAPEIDADPWGSGGGGADIGTGGRSVLVEHPPTPTPPARLPSPVPDERVDGGWGYDSTSGWGEDRSPPAPKPPDDHPPAAEAGQGSSYDRAIQDDAPAEIPLPTSPDIDNPPQPFASLDIHPGPSSTLDVPTDEPDPEAAFAAALPGSSSPSSPTLDEGFGGFSTSAGSGNGNDPWGGAGRGFGESGWGEAGGGRGSGRSSGARTPDEEEGEGWGGARSVKKESVVKTTAEEDWEEAQRTIQIKQQRAPQEKIQALQTEWKEVAMSVIGMEKLEPLTEDDERRLQGAVRELNSDTAETLRSLSTLPPGIDTNPPVISSLTTHERHAYALVRPNPTPSTSLLNLSLARRARRSAAMATDSPWLSRSKLGEPDMPVENQSNKEATSSKGWSFWGRKSAQDKPLITSGGGILEVKSVPAITASTTTTGPGTLMSSVRASVEMRPTMSRPGSIGSGPISRPGSPATPAHDDVGHDAPGGMVESVSQASVASTTTPTQAPSAVSRFFGRISRKTPSTRTTEVDSKDLELSADDFTFLQEVPSMTSPPTERGIGDLLSLEPGSTEQIASLESILTSKPTPLPAPLAPPPRGPMASASSGSANARFATKMKTEQRQVSDMDLLGGLSFDPPPSVSTPPLGSTEQTIGKESVSMWDEFLTPSSSPVKPPSVQPLPGPTPLSTQPVSNLKPFSSPGRPAQKNLNNANSMTLNSPFPMSRPAQSTQAQSPPNIPASDLDDFGTPQKAGTTSAYDDFGDFAAFDTPATPLHHPMLNAPSGQGQGQGHGQGNGRERGQMDHTATLSLMSGASATKGRRWPAPPSPIGPILDPPPKAQSQSAGFPFLSPPPPSRSSSAPNTLFNDADLLSEPTIPPPSGPSPVFPSGVSQGMMSPPPPPPGGSGSNHAARQTQNMMTPMPSAPMKKTARGSQGLSAQDLSFFDSL